MDNFEIKYSSGRTDKVKRVPRKKLHDLIVLQQDLLYAFLKNNASVGSVIASNSNWSTIEKIAKLLPVIGEEKPGINLDELEDDISQITSIFFTQSVDENGMILNTDEGYKPSLIAELHQLDYYGNARDAAKKIYQERKEEEQVLLS